MDYAARLSAEPSRSPSSLRPVLVAGSSAAARARGVAEVEAAGLRLADAVPISEALERLRQQASASAVWVELDGDGGVVLDHLLDEVDRDADSGRYGAVIAAPRALIDPVSARINSARVELLIDGDAGARVAAMALATRLPTPGARVSDVASDNSTARLRQLSDEVGRIAATLARLSTGPASAPVLAPQAADAAAGPDDDPAPDIARDQLRQVIRARRARARYFPADLFADPAWDMLLDLMQAELAQIRVPVSSLCIAAAVPATTALRWIKTLTDSGMLVRRADPHDGRRVFVEMAPATSTAMRRYFGEVGRVAVI